MSKYIDADKLIKEFDSLEQLARKRVYDTPTNSPAYERYSTQYCEREKALSIIKAQPTADVVEVVRCKDCKHRNSGRMSCQGRHPDWYCPKGERREE